MRRRVVLAAAAALGVSAVAQGTAEATAFPARFPLPDGFMPEGIAIGAWPTAYFGSRADGSIHQVDLATGQGRTLATGPGTPSLGIKVDSVRRRLFVAGGTGGDLRVLDARNGRTIASYKLFEGESFVNDLVITSGAVWITDSDEPTLYRLPLGRGGELPRPEQVTRVPLTGEMEDIPDLANANGIVTTPDGRGFIVGQTATGKLFRVDRHGATKEIDLGGAVMTQNDGLLREGRDLYVVQNRVNLFTKLRLTRDASAARVVRQLSDPRFDVPATVAAWGNRFYLVNGRFSTPPTPTTTYDAVAIDKF
ncbi:superoxide dismutase [Actinosynnema sp. ALI-1.44]|uniref:SMP-30/gluconolactonase/LRE family protein n=1 Tax=Actinosynnema sp. ALI-1.44 TaxID=1933779 RepID=UPI00097BF349|nr:SMP-30/gluconolactonase/LRE family protein [Actinosynnema sp. ALI-1.44]ONI77811.1 superoxide dismutase [Actinosynnema sp. ALI-1.44]